MILPKEAITEFMDIYKKEYGTEIDQKEARKIAVKLLGFLEAISRPERKNQYEN